MVTKGDLPIDIRWTIGSQPIVSGEQGFSITRINSRTSALNMEYLDAFHRGVFKCVVSNSAGFAEYSAILEVNGWQQIF